MDTAQIKQTIRRELPAIMREDPGIQQFVLRLVREQFADKMETESRFDQLLAELRSDREAQEKRWEAQERKWENQEQRWAEYQQAQEQKWKAQVKKWEAQEQRWAEHQQAQEQRWAEHQQTQEQKWADNQVVINQMLEDIQRLFRRYDSSVGALGARWGIRSERSFRNALKSILEESFEVKVLNTVEFDDEGYVFGHPDQVELDIIIKNGLLIICEIKSSMSRNDMYIFGRKVAFYEDRHGKKATRKLVISPMVEEYARQVAKKLGIEIHSHADDVMIDNS